MSYHARALVGPQTSYGVVEVLWFEAEGRAVIIRIVVAREDVTMTQDFDPANYQED